MFQLSGVHYNRQMQGVDTRGLVFVLLVGYHGEPKVNLFHNIRNI